MSLSTESQLVRCIEEIVALSGISATVTPDTVPLADIPDFVSHNAVEATCLLSERMGREIKGDVELFISPCGTKYSTIREIAARVDEQLKGAK